MTIERIDLDLCDGCGICEKVCSMDVIRMDEGSKKPVIKYAEDCSCCAACEYECPQKAIYVSPERHTPILVSW